MLRVAMLSMAHVHANGYAQAVVDHPEAEIVAIWEDDKGRGEAATERFGVQYEMDLEKVVSRDDVDAVVINAYTSQHPWIIKTALKYGKHDFTEKALCIKTVDADEIVKMVNESGIKFMISLPSRTRGET
ncbi:MAG: Gfo/Idh/MocA family oxidoreductase, partial [Anaerolineae bacterium]|nr:Gfo/Idh/MocA family oxidoreductase [Anaerolineae bacterium]